MLVLSRKVGERINIGADIEVEVRSIQGNRVGLAIYAPRQERILRGELVPVVVELETEPEQRKDGAA